MKLREILLPEAVFPSLLATCEKQAFLRIAGHVSRLTGVSEREVFEVLMERERLGNTGMGGGVAIPHGRLPGIDHLRVLFVRLNQPIDFHANDGQPVDILFVLLAPVEESGEHLKVLARISRLVGNKDIMERLRSAADAKTLYRVLTEEG